MLRTSPLQLLRYAVTEISYSSNNAFNPEDESNFDINKYIVATDIARETDQPDGDQHFWYVELKITQPPSEGINYPYSFGLSMFGHFVCPSNAPEGLDEARYVQINGSSMLYGVAREIIRATTSRGPWGEVMIPTLTFFTPPSDGNSANPEAGSEVKSEGAK